MNLIILSTLLAVVSFKDAAKIQSWDAWDDHKKNATFKEKRCVTREKLLAHAPKGMEEIGWLETHTAGTIKSDQWSVGVETLDRDYANWDKFKQYLPLLGVTHARFFSGWAKTEQEKGKYDYAWLDKQLRECKAMNVKPWVCLSYGNPVWGSDFRLGMKVKQVTDSPEAFEAWLRYVKTTVERYRDIVDEWEVWNEPFGQAEYAKMFYHTAKLIKEIQPQAKVFCTAITYPKDYVRVLDLLKENNALDLASYFIYHPYTPNPDSCYAKEAEPLRRLVKSYNPTFDIMQGEVGCPSQLEFAHAMANIEWTEYSQAKWNLRRAMGDAIRSIKSNCFTLIDLKYTFMLQSFGLIRSNLLQESVYRRPSYYAMQNVYSFFDEEVHPLSVTNKVLNGRTTTIARFERQGASTYVIWHSDKVPSSDLYFDYIDAKDIGPIPNFSWVDLMTGRICKINDGKIPVWDSPVMLASNIQLPRRTVWEQMTPAQIVDSLYRPWQGLCCWGGNPKMNIKMATTNEPWIKMQTSEFLPCFDKYGQFKYREWPGKTHSDAELAAAAAEEEKDLSAHPGPAGWTKFGGWQAGPQLKATGRFRTEKIEGKWWLVDPEGRLFWSWGPVRVTPSSAVTPLNGNPRTPRCGGPLPDRDCLFEGLPKKGEALAQFYDTYDSLLLSAYLSRGETRRFDFSAANIYRKYGTDWFNKYSDSCHRRLRSWGCNTIANSSDLRICLQDRTPYAERVEVRSRPIEGSWGIWFKFRDPFDQSFIDNCRKGLEEHGREAHDPWCIGFFIDNEINWGNKHEDLGRWTLWSPDNQPAKIELLKRLAAKGIVYDAAKGPDSVPAEELRAFTDVLVEEYFKRTRETVKSVDPGLLYLGCRFAGSTRDWVIGPCAKYCDVVSYNIYRDEIGKWRLPQNLDAPVLIGEFHFGAHDRGLFGSGLINKGSQQGRADALKTYVESALGNPQIVGVHWHQFSDQATSGRFDGEFFQVGWTDICDRPYRETIDALRSIDIYKGRSAAGK